MIREIKILRPGCIVRTKSGMVKDARSTITLIRGEENHILVDSSRKIDEERLIQALKKQKMSPSDIDILINTHHHHDHVGNNDLFSEARVYVHGKNGQTASTERINSFPYLLENDIEIIETLGHSWDSVTVLVKKREIYAITGDAIPTRNNYIEWVPPFIHVDGKLALESMKRIVQAADIIIPGHDYAFRVKKT